PLPPTSPLFPYTTLFRSHFLLDAALEVAVAREHGADHELALRHGSGHRLGQGARVADAGGAAVAHEVEPQLLEIPHQPRLLEIIDRKSTRLNSSHVSISY